MSRASSTRFARLRSLKCFDEVHSRILHGFALADVVRFIQQEKCEYTDVEPSSLNSLLVDYRKSLPAAVAISKTNPIFCGKAVVEVQDKLDELEELNKLFALQMSRLDIDLTNEQTIKKLLPTTAREIELARHILETSAQLKMDLGLDDRHIGSLDINADISAAVEKRFGGAVGKVMADPNSRRKILGVLDRLGSIAKKAVTDEDHQLAETPSTDAEVKAEAG